MFINKLFQKKVENKVEEEVHSVKIHSAKTLTQAVPLNTPITPFTP
jgi:porphobilinogen deaminase